jgi:hypothetical protein
LSPGVQNPTAERSVRFYNAPLVLNEGLGCRSLGGRLQKAGAAIEDIWGMGRDAGKVVGWTNVRLWIMRLIISTAGNAL